MNFENREKGAIVQFRIYSTTLDESLTPHPECVTPTILFPALQRTFKDTFYVSPSYFFLHETQHQQKCHKQKRPQPSLFSLFCHTNFAWKYGSTPSTICQLQDNQNAFHSTILLMTTYETSTLLYRRTLLPVRFRVELVVSFIPHHWNLNCVSYVQKLVWHTTKHKHSCSTSKSSHLQSRTSIPLDTCP